MEAILIWVGIILFIVFVRRIFKKKKPAFVPYVKPTLADYSQASQEEKNQLFIEWCRRNNKSVKTRRTEKQLDAYVFEMKLPDFDDWKEIHGFKRSEWVAREVYTNWLKYIGAYYSKFDPDSPDWDGR